MFEAPEGELANRTLEILMFDYDQFSHDECVGQVLFPLDQFTAATALNSAAACMYWRPLAPYERKPEVK